MKGFFAKILDKEMRDRGFGQTDMARYLGVQQTDIFRWLKRGSSPNGDDMVDMLKRLGWDLDRAKPSAAAAEAVAGVAEEAAGYDSGKGSKKGAVKGVAEIDGIITGATADINWGRERVPLPFPLSLNNLDNKYFLLSVKGNHLAPQFPAGSIIIASREREPRNGDLVVLNTNCLRRCYPIKGRSEGLAVSLPNAGSEGMEIEIVSTEIKAVVVSTMIA